MEAPGAEIGHERLVVLQTRPSHSVDELEMGRQVVARFVLDYRERQRSNASALMDARL
jgi:hypothetical protein